jgi:hypothetical protein
VELRLAAKAAGITIPALMEALAVPSVSRNPVDGQKAFTRLTKSGSAQDSTRG